MKLTHEIRDPIHTFVHFDHQERMVIDSPPIQRLRQIHQLATTYLVYPGATHRRFEHCLGVMDLAGRVFDVITNPENLSSSIRDLVSPDLVDESMKRHWRSTVRMAALCHDIGHLPFSHAAERELLPEGWDHEMITKELILSPVMQDLWQNMRPPLNPTDIAKLAVGPQHFGDSEPSDVEAILSELIVGDALGVDRIDYLLRDSLHTGVGYGRFDHFRLVDTLRILPSPQYGDETESIEPQLGVEEGGLKSAEALLLARYFMFSQVYFHRVRRAYDIHLKDFLSSWLPTGRFPISLEEFLEITDAEVTSAMLAASRNKGTASSEFARRITERDHFRALWERNPIDVQLNPDAGNLIHNAAVAKYGEDAIRRDSYSPKSPTIDFPVRDRDERVVSAQSESEVLQKVPVAAFDFIFVRRDLVDDAKQWWKRERDNILDQDERNGKDGESPTTTPAS